MTTRTESPVLGYLQELLDTDAVEDRGAFEDAIHDLIEQRDELLAHLSGMIGTLRGIANDLSEAAPEPQMGTPLSPEELVWKAVDDVQTFGLHYVNRERGDTPQEQAWNYVLDAKEFADMEPEGGPDYDALRGVAADLLDRVKWLEKEAAARD